MNTALTILACLGAVLAVAATCVHGFSARWWADRLGRALFAQSAGISLILGYVSFHRLVTPPELAPDESLQAAITVYGVIVAMEWAVLVAYLRETWAARRARRGGTR